MAKSDKLPHLGLSPRGPAGVYRHSMRTRIWPKLWSEDTQTASSGTLVIRAPRDQSLNFRQELWSYQGENRHAPEGSVRKSPGVTQPFRVSTNRLGKSLDAGNLGFHEATKEQIRPLVRFSSENYLGIEQKGIEDLDTNFGLLNRFHTKKKNVNMTVDGMLSARYGNFTDFSFEKLRRFNSEERLQSETHRMIKWHTEKCSGMPGNKSLISIVGKLPTVNKGCAKTLQAIQRDKIGGNTNKIAYPNANASFLSLGHVGTDNVETSESKKPQKNKNPVSTRTQYDRKVNDKRKEQRTHQEDHKTAATSPKVVKIGGHIQEQNTPGRIHEMSSLNKCLNPVSLKSGTRMPMQTSKDVGEGHPNPKACDFESQGHPNLESQLPRKVKNGSADDIGTNMKWVRSAIDTEAMIDSGGYDKFAHSKSSTSPKSSVKGGNFYDAR